MKHLRKMIKTLSAFALASLMMAPATLEVHAQADLVVHNADVYTMNDQLRRAEAFAVRDGRIVFVGTSDAALARFPEAQRLDAEGRSVLPGLIDAHAHLMGLGTSMLQVDLMGAATIDDVIDRLRRFEEGLPEDVWLTGRGWDQNAWPEKAFPTREHLDAAFPDRPVWLRRVDGHAAWANTAALEAAGIDRIRAAVDPEGGRIVRDERGEPSGVFVDAAMDLVEEHVPPLTDEQYAEALRLALRETARYGITGIHDAGISLRDIRLYQRAIDEGWFSLRLYGMIGGRGETFDHVCETGMIEDYGDRLTVRSVKFYMDGALGSRGAALLDDYADDPGNRGLLMREPSRFEEDVVAAVACGLQVNTHAIGDRGNRVVLDAYESAMQRATGEAGRHRIEHAQVVSIEDIPRFAELDVIASMQPTHATSDMYWAEDRVGTDRIRGAYAWRRYLNKGVPVAFGSDFPVERVNPLLGFHAAITRQDADGWPEGGWYPSERVTRMEALRGFTLDAAFAAFQEEHLGSIEVGKWADFVILSDDIMTIAAPRILEAQVEATYVGGEVVYEAP